MTLEVDDNLIIAFGAFVIVFFIVGMLILAVDFIRKFAKGQKSITLYMPGTLPKDAPKGSVWGVDEDGNKTLTYPSGYEITYIDKNERK